MLKTANQADALLEIANNGYTHQPESVTNELIAAGYIEPMISGLQRFTLTPKGLTIMRAHGYRGVPNYCRNTGLGRASNPKKLNTTGLRGNAHADDRYKD